MAVGDVPDKRSTVARPRHGASPPTPLAPAAASKPLASPRYSAPPAGAPPQAPPPFSAADIRRAIPPALFERSALLGFVHLARDLVVIAALVAANAFVQTSEAPLTVKAVCWLLYAFFAGSYGFGVWIIAHECGHQAFSDYRALNDALGFVLHSALLVPYWSWAFSHHEHHGATGSLEDDEVHVPVRVGEPGYTNASEETPLGAAAGIATMLATGWPLYLLANYSGPAKYHGKDNSHFTPTSVLFTRAQAPFVVASAAGVAATLCGLGAAAAVWGAPAVAAWYGAPLLVVNAILVLVTYLQHTGPAVPRYAGAEFSWLRGALSTVDRSFGPLLDDAFHHIADSHVVHHLFHTMPFYNAVKATPYVKAVLGEYYLSDPTPIPLATWRVWATCKFVDPADGGILYCRADDGRRTK